MDASTNRAPTRYFLYARKSTDDTSHQVRSIDDQIAELRDLARKQNLEVVEVLIERQSAKSPGRPVFGEMLRRIGEGEANAILSWHPDRLARNALDGGQILHLLDEKVITDLRFAIMPFEVSPSGKFTLAIMFGQSKYYVDNLSENIKRGHRRKVAEGIWPAHCPIGYLNDKSRKVIAPDAARAPLVREVFTIYSTGLYTIDQITETAHGLNLLSREGELLSRAQIHRMLTNPLYCGIIDWKGQVSEGRHEPIVPKELFDKVQAVISRKAKPRKPRLKPYLYRGVFRCGECGCAITTETQKGHNYLRCTKRVKKDCSQPYVREEEVTRQVAVEVASLGLAPSAADEVIGALRAKQDQGHAHAAGAAVAAHALCREIDAKISRLTDAYVAQVLSLDEYRGARERLVSEKQLAKDRIAAIEANRAGWFEPAIRFVEAAKQATILAEAGTETEKREFLRKAGSNLSLRNRALEFHARGAWQLLANQGVLPPNDKAAPPCGAASPRGESRHHLKRACGRHSPFGLRLPQQSARHTAYRPVDCVTRTHAAARPKALAARTLAFAVHCDPDMPCGRVFPGPAAGGQLLPNRTRLQRGGCAAARPPNCVAPEQTQPDHRFKLLVVGGSSALLMPRRRHQRCRICREPKACDGGSRRLARAHSEISTKTVLPAPIGANAGGFTGGMPQASCCRAWLESRRRRATRSSAESQRVT